MLAAGGADVESKNVVNGVDAFIEAEPRHRIVVSLNRGHCNHRRASLMGGSRVVAGSSQPYRGKR